MSASLEFTVAAAPCSLKEFLLPRHAVNRSPCSLLARLRRFALGVACYVCDLLDKSSEAIGGNLETTPHAPVHHIWARHFDVARHSPGARYSQGKPPQREPCRWPDPGHDGCPESNETSARCIRLAYSRTASHSSRTQISFRRLQSCPRPVPLCLLWEPYSRPENCKRLQRVYT